MREWLAGRKVWLLIVGFILFVVGFQLVEMLVGPAPSSPAEERVVAAPEPESEPEPIPIKVTRSDPQTVKIVVAADGTQIRLGVDTEREAEELFACINDGIAAAIEKDPSLVEPAPGGWIVRQQHNDDMVQQVRFITDACVSEATSTPRDEDRRQARRER